MKYIYIYLSYLSPHGTFYIINTCLFQTDCKWFSVALCFCIVSVVWNDLAGQLVAGNCLSLNVVSSIPAWSTAISRFLCGLYAFPMFQSMGIKTTNIYKAAIIILLLNSSWIQTYESYSIETRIYVSAIPARYTVYTRFDWIKILISYP